MPIRPGGELATRPLHFIWIADCSASMSMDGKMQSLNTAIRESLPHMRTVADENPTATVYVRTLRFSSGARWIQNSLNPLDRFQWVDLEADEVPRTAEFAAEFRGRLQREQAKTGDVQISLIWNNWNDLDLHVMCPHQEEICFAHRMSECGGELDVDMNVSPTSTEPVENVYFPSGRAPHGHYRVYVHHYRNHGLSGCSDPTRFKVAVKAGGIAREFAGSVSAGQTPLLVHEFDLDGRQSTAVAPTVGGSGNTDMGAALRMLADALRIPPMTDRALPPVLVLVSDGHPTDDFEAGLTALLAQPWGRKAVRIAIAIGDDTDDRCLERFIGHSELKPLRANNPEALVRRIRWASTVVLKAASAPASQVIGQAAVANVPIPMPTDDAAGASSADVW